MEFLVIWAAFAVGCCFVAKSKNRNAGAWAVAGLFYSPTSSPPWIIGLSAELMNLSRVSGLFCQLVIPICRDRTRGMHGHAQGTVPPLVEELSGASTPTMPQ